jgi:hypothetical protein
MILRPEDDLSGVPQACLLSVRPKPDRRGYQSELSESSPPAAAEFAEQRWAAGPFRFPQKYRNPNKTRGGIDTGFSIPVSA